MSGRFRSSRDSSVAARFGALAELGFVPLLASALRYRRALGLTNGDFMVVHGILLQHRARDEWRSWSQDDLARALDIRRTTLNRHIAQLRDLGHLAVRPDPRFRPKPGLDSTLFYCLDPLLACLAMLAAVDLGEAPDDLGARLEGDAELRFGDFLTKIAAGQWRWRFGSMDTAAGASAVEVAKAYATRFRISFEATRR